MGRRAEGCGNIYDGKRYKGVRTASATLRLRFLSSDSHLCCVSALGAVEELPWAPMYSGSRHGSLLFVAIREVDVVPMTALKSFRRGVHHPVFILAW